MQPQIAQMAQMLGGTAGGDCWVGGNASADGAAPKRLREGGVSQMAQMLDGHAGWEEMRPQIAPITQMLGGNAGWEEMRPPITQMAQMLGGNAGGDCWVGGIRPQIAPITQMLNGHAWWNCRAVEWWGSCGAWWGIERTSPAGGRGLLWVVLG